MIRALKYYIQSSFKNMWRHFPQTLMSATAVTITLSLISAFMIVAINISEITNGIAADVRIQATVDSAISQEKINEIESKIKQLSEVKEVVYSTKHQELDKFIAATPQGEETYGQYKGDQNPLRDAFYIELKEEVSNNSNARKERLKVVTAEIKKIEGIVDAQYGGQTVENLVVLLSRIRIAGYILATGLAILSILLIQNAIKSTIYSRQNEIAIMRNVGASNGFIKIPFMLEGVYIGILGSIIPVTILLLAYEPLYNILSGMRVFSFVVPYPFVFIMSGLLLVSGMLVGLIGSFLSVTKYLRFKR